MQLEVVNIEDVYPDENNPRQKFDGIDELAESFELNKERPGEPFTPPILVRDGGIYRIVDGERRYKALKKRRKTSFTANVCDDMDEANTLMAMLATDNKQPLSELEKSRGVQQMLLLGVDPVQVDKTTKGTHAKRIKRAMDRVQDAAEDMTLDRLLAIDEFSDDPEVVEKLTNCSQKAWEHIADSARRERKTKKRMAEVKAELENRGYRIVESSPEDCYYSGQVRTIKDIDGINVSPDEVVLKIGYNNQSYEILKYREKNEQNNELIAAIKRTKDEIIESEQNRAIWFGDKLNDANTVPCLREIARESFIYINSHVLNYYADDLQVDLDCEPCKLALIVGYERSYVSIAAYADDIIDNSKLNKWNAERFYDYCKVLDAFIQDGYKPEPWETELFAKIYAARDRAKEAMDNA